MQKLNAKFFRILGVLLGASILGCAGGDRGKLPQTQSPTESELVQNWDDYTVYYRKNMAFIFKLKDDKRIVLDNQWVEIKTQEMMDDSKISSATWVKKILDQKNEMYGYLVQRDADQANVAVIDDNTVQLYYIYVATCCGP